MSASAPRPIPATPSLVTPLVAALLLLVADLGAATSHSVGVGGRTVYRSGLADDERRPRRPSRRDREAAAESSTVLRIRDIRLTAGSAPFPDHVEEDRYAIAAADRDHDLQEGIAYQAAIAYHGGRLRRGGGFVWGVGLQYMRGSYEAPLAPGTTLDITLYGPFGQIGYGYAFSPRWHAELTASLSLLSGPGTWVSSPGAPEQSDTALGLGGGVMLGTYWAATEDLVVGLQGGWAQWGASLSVDGGGSSKDDLRITGKGPAAQLAIGWRF